jgi:hypothetical protein
MFFIPCNDEIATGCNSTLQNFVISRGILHDVERHRRLDLLCALLDNPVYSELSVNGTETMPCSVRC